MPCDICGKGRYPRPHGRCKAKIRREMAEVRVSHSSRESAVAAYKRLYDRIMYGEGVPTTKWGVNPAVGSEPAAEWSESDDVALTRWMDGEE